MNKYTPWELFVFFLIAVVWIFFLFSVMGCTAQKKEPSAQVRYHYDGKQIHVFIDEPEREE